MVELSIYFDVNETPNGRYFSGSMVLEEYQFSIFLIAFSRRCKIVGGGVTPPHKTRSGRPRRYHAAIFAPGFYPRRNSLRREGGEYNTLRGNKPALLLTSRNSLRCQPPATSAPMTRRTSGAPNANEKGAPMETIPIPIPLAVECLALLAEAAYEHKQRLDAAAAMAALSPWMAASISQTSTSAYQRYAAAHEALLHHLGGGAMQ